MNLARYDVKHTLNITWLAPPDAAKFLGVKERTLKAWRLDGTHLEGVHFSRITQRSTRYNRDALSHWVATRHCPQVHVQWCKGYLQNLHSSVKGDGE